MAIQSWKGWFFLALSVLFLFSTIQVFNAAFSYQDVIIPSNMESFPVHLFNIKVGEASTTQGLNEFANTFLMLIPIPLILSAVCYKFSKQ
ncbi:hypothetical protein [[Bacillus] enclensis]|uniref:hypothetical protein n=1 Tax=[Bacillus] enclensis TaxID=1402860 RepID=UPI0018DBE7D4|nr:hypothetical protein [[Bacillus] enclensis]MBH9968900.1 hypothetical protein [[Bacillus] enclensis]